MGTSQGNFKRKLTGFYDNEDRKKQWSQARINTNKNSVILNHKKTIQQLTKLKINVQWFELQLQQHRITTITKNLKLLDIKHPKLALKYLKSLLEPKRLKEIAKEKRTSKTSVTLKNRLRTDIILKKKYIKNLTKRNHHKYRSKGELRLKHWLQKTYPYYNWKSIHLTYNNSIYEFDIYSEQYDDFFIEYNGACHYKQIHSLENFQRIQCRDEQKIQIMKELNKEFLIIKDSMSFEEQTKTVTKFFNLSSNLQIKKLEVRGHFI